MKLTMYCGRDLQEAASAIADETPSKLIRMRPQPFRLEDICNVNN